MTIFNLRFFAFLIIIAPFAFYSCVSYKDINKVYQPSIHSHGNLKTLPLDYFEGVSQGDKIQVTDKSQVSYDMMFSTVNDGELIGLLFRDPITKNKVEPYEFSIPISSISQVIGIGKGSEMKGKPKPDFYFSDLYKIKKGEMIRVKKKSGNIQYMYFNEFSDERIYGDSLGTDQRESPVETKKVEISLHEIDQIQVKRLKPLQTLGLVAGIAIGTLVVAFIISPPDFGF